jgi:outer membrane protein assembly factor BamB
LRVCYCQSLVPESTNPQSVEGGVTNRAQRMSWEADMPMVLPLFDSTMESLELREGGNCDLRTRLITVLVALFALLMFESACGGGATSQSDEQNSRTGPFIVTQPANATVNVGQTATFTVTASGTPPLSYQWQKNGADISGATAAEYTTPAAEQSDSGSVFRVIVTDTSGSTASNSAALTVNPIPPPPKEAVLTYHNDNARTGQDLDETILTSLNVNISHFGKVGFLPVTGSVYAEPLYVPNLNIMGAVRNVVFVVTEHDLVYAFDADTFDQLWEVSVVGSNEQPSDDLGCQEAISPEIGITSTPVIDLEAGPHGTVFLVAASMDGKGHYYHRLHALDLATGAEQNGGPTTIQATFPSLNGDVTFDPAQHLQRAALLLLNGTIYVAWTSHCDVVPYYGWVMGYNEYSLQQTSVFNTAPNGIANSIWMAGAGPAADNSGAIYLLTSNGVFDTTLDPNGFPMGGDYGNAFLKLAASTDSLTVADYFSVYNTAAESALDLDLGSGGLLLLPDLQDSAGKTWHLAVGAGKDANIYVVNRDSMGKFNPDHNAIYQEIDNALSYGSFGMPAYFNNTIYYGAPGDFLKAFTISNAKLLAQPTSQSSTWYHYPGTTPSISANGSLNGIVWTIESIVTADHLHIGVLHAYDAKDLSKELYNSNQSNGRDQFTFNKFVTPMIAHGKVYVATPTGVAVFGLIR